MSAIKSNKPAEGDQQNRENGVEGEIREFVRRDGGQALRRAPESDSDLVAHNISTLVQRVAGTSVQEVDRLIAELQQLRDLLHQEGARVQREIAEYAHLSQSAMQSTKIIAESLAHWKGEGGLRGIRG
jgi:cell division septum initiation protein DivIVA